MATLSVNIDNKKSEKAVKAMLDALDLSYSFTTDDEQVTQPPNKAEEVIYHKLRRALEQIILHQEGRLKLNNIDEVITELRK
ncbi:hypothetical protein [Mucilaginibacter xinganensis]|uniref:Uncharacterized protein n=1 Tax=Mucilaginibacter xinganensis TaxID=1234841 RepID=A0A223NV77_9SPHI|nr:hypothetical protein [Mucilaginibacter xinganensis]ASU33795.1 hypothetical protein MuYL_1899 [Mucilaginibacter xinganensis]